MLLGKPSDANASRGSTASRLGGAAEAFYYVFAACFGGDSYEYSSAPLKILQIALLIFIFVTGATYTANLVSFLNQVRRDRAHLYDQYSYNLYATAPTMVCVRR